MSNNFIKIFANEKWEMHWSFKVGFQILEDYIYVYNIYIV